MKTKIGFSTLGLKRNHGDDGALQISAKIPTATRETGPRSIHDDLRRRARQPLPLSAELASAIANASRQCAAEKRRRGVSSVPGDVRWGMIARIAVVLLALAIILWIGTEALFAVQRLGPLR